VTAQPAMLPPAALLTVATTCVREDMAVALVQAFGRFYEQPVLAGDPGSVLERAILHAMAPRPCPTRLKLWPDAGSPYGMGLEDKRRFAHYVRGAHDPIWALVSANHGRFGL
jgi:hypothetical protein